MRFCGLVSKSAKEKENGKVKATIYREGVEFTTLGDYSLVLEIIEKIEANDLQSLLSSLQCRYAWSSWSSNNPKSDDWLVSKSEIPCVSFTCRFEEKLTQDQIKAITKTLKIK